MNATRSAFLLVLLAAAPLAGAQSQSTRASPGTIRWTGPATPVCVYKGVMSDAEIEACTGRRVHYDYRVVEEEKTAASR